jgi:hypothetical protein
MKSEQSNALIWIFKNTFFRRNIWEITRIEIKKKAHKNEKKKNKTIKTKPANEKNALNIE